MKGKRIVKAVTDAVKQSSKAKAKNDAAVNSRYSYYTYLTSKAGAWFMDGTMMIPCPKKAGEYAVRICTTDEKGGKEAASASFRVE